jgi:hypothetical protein
LFTYAGILRIKLSLIFILLASLNEISMSSLCHRLMKVSTTFVWVSRVMDPFGIACWGTGKQVWKDQTRCCF